MYQDYLPIIIFTALAVVLIAVPLGLQHLLSPRHNKGGEKLVSYECGEVPEGSAWIKFNIRFYIIALILLLLVDSFGITSSGSKRWISLFFINLQPSELMKVSLILFLARYYYKIPTQNVNHIKHIFDGQFSDKRKSRKDMIQTAKLYLNSPYLWGGKTPFGIDCSGLTQIVYRLQGINIPRDAYQQAEIGTTLSFIEESEAGDLAFFDDHDGKIIHVGIIMENNHIIHASGRVRIDRIDQQGIFNKTLGTHTHKLRLIKSIT